MRTNISTTQQQIEDLRTMAKEAGVSVSGYIKLLTEYAWEDYEFRSFIIEKAKGKVKSYQPTSHNVHCADQKKLEAHCEEITGRLTILNNKINRLFAIINQEV